MKWLAKHVGSEHAIFHRLHTRALRTPSPRHAAILPPYMFLLSPLSSLFSLSLFVQYHNGTPAQLIRKTFDPPLMPPFILIILWAKLLAMATKRRKRYCVLLARPIFVYSKALFSTYKGIYIVHLQNKNPDIVKYIIILIISFMR